MATIVNQQTNYYVNQQINIHTIKIGGISNSSFLQIGSAGIINSCSNLYNSGGFKEAAPQIAEPTSTSLVPLTSP
ncbi:spore germination protein GerPB [Bacillus solimangrovi]|uniref:Spore gernimation protein KA n=1 Tax=Bacillus solimangrovi TaxID=1305675 RepID=A0A1E5LCE6_9BACI|nr:spore germination protein GerPB [Bacillus solimangrovi]OEH91669.1 spore gernimation protein KA [Bacillus solimangrovi]